MLNQLYKKTALQKNFAANWMAVSGLGQMPERLTLRGALSSFLDFRVECVRRRTQFLLRKAEVCFSHDPGTTSMSVCTWK